MESSWNFLSNHAHVLLCLATGQDPTLREIAERVGITERATFRIVTELEEAGVIERTRCGRRNHYEIRYDHPLRHALERHCTVGQLLAMVTEAGRGGSE